MWFEEHRDWRPYRRSSPTVCVVSFYTPDLLVAPAFGRTVAHQNANYCMAHGYTYSIFIGSQQKLTGSSLLWLGNSMLWIGSGLLWLGSGLVWLATSPLLDLHRGKVFGRQALGARVNDEINETVP